MKYFILFFILITSFSLQANWGFSAEEKVVRLIDLSPKEEVEGTGAQITHTNSGKVVEKEKIKEKKNIIDKTNKEENSEEDSDEKGDVTSKEDSPKDEKETVQSLINSYILETYKAQGDKILKDMDINLQKKIPDIEKRIQAYTSIQTTLELRKNRILKVDISEVNKTLLSTYFDYMIEALEKKKESMRE